MDALRAILNSGEGTLHVVLAIWKGKPAILSKPMSKSRADDFAVDMRKQQKELFKNRVTIAPFSKILVVKLDRP